MYRFVEREKANHHLVTLCRILGVIFAAQQPHRHHHDATFVTGDDLFECGGIPTEDEPNEPGNFRCLRRQLAARYFRHG